MFEKILSHFNPATGEIAGAPTLKRHLSDLRGCFADAAAFEAALAKNISGQLALTLETKNGKILAKSKRAFSLEALGAGDFPITLNIPNKPQDNLILKVTATSEHKIGVGPTVSRRWLSVTK